MISSSINGHEDFHSQLNLLHQLFVSCSNEDFIGPKLTSNISRNKLCFLCRKNLSHQGPILHCDLCPLTYHLHCLKTRNSSLDLTVRNQWICPNHLTPIIDRYRMKSNQQRVRIFDQSSKISSNTVRQDFKKKKLTKTLANKQSECVQISQIPLAIKQFYSKSDQTSNEHQIKNISSPPPLLSQSSSVCVYDPTVWNVLQSILDDITNTRTYELSPFIETKPSNETKANPFETMDYLIEKLDQPNSSLESVPVKTISNFCSDMIDLSQFRQSHAALIHLRSKQVIYIRKHVIWFGSSSFNDISLEKFHFCPHVTDRHACLYFDEKSHRFELLNYSEYGVRVNEFNYGFTESKYSSTEQCFCSNQILSQSSIWDGPALIDQGTVIHIGCHEFLFYRHIVR